MIRKLLILSVLVLAGATFTGATWYNMRPEPVSKLTSVPPKLAEGLIRSHSPSLGPQDAPVTIVEFFDPACEACRAFYPIVKDIMTKEGGSVRLVLRYTPFHRGASEEAIRVLEAARMQNVFEPVLEAILREQPRWATHGAEATDELLQIAAAAGLNVEEARSQMLFPGTTGIINQDRADVEAMGVKGTPTFFVNGIRLDPFGEDELRALVAKEIKASGGS